MMQYNIRFGNASVVGNARLCNVNSVVGFVDSVHVTVRDIVIVIVVVVVVVTTALKLTHSKKNDYKNEHSMHA